MSEQINELKQFYNDAIKAKDYDLAEKALNKIESLKSTPTPTPTNKPYPGQQYIEPALAIASSVVAEPIAGASSLLYAPFIGAEGAAEMVGSTRDRLTYSPRSQQSRDNLKAMGDFIQPIIEPVVGAVNNFADSQFDKAQQLKQQGRPMTFRGVQVDPSIFGAGIKTAPVAAAEMVGLKGAQAFRGGVPLLRDGSPTPQLEGLLNQKGLSFDGLTPESRSLVPSTAPKGLIPSLKREAGDVGGLLQKSQLSTGGRDNALAKIMLEGDRIVKDPLAKKAIDKGWRESTVMLAKTANDQTRKAMDDMLTKRWALSKNDSLNFEPSNIVGDAFNDRIKFITSKANEARLKLNEISKSQKFKSTVLDPKPILQTMKSKLDDLNVKYSYSGNKLNLDFSDSVLAANNNSQKAIKDVLKLIRPDRSATAESLHLLKRQLDDLIDFKKKSKDGISEEGRRFLKDLRYETNQVLRKSIDDYADTNDILSKSLTALDDFKSASKVDLDYFDDPSDAIGRQLRKLHTNYASRDKIGQTANKIDELANEWGGDFQTNYSDLANFANRLDERFGSSRSGDFQGKMEASNSSILGRVGFSYATEGAPGAMREGLATGKGLLKRFGGEDDYNAYQSLKGLLNR